jgi:hypothetical protein
MVNDRQLVGLRKSSLSAHSADNTGVGAVVALIEGGFVVIFFEAPGSNRKFWRKCALLIWWWPVIAAKIKRARKASFYHVPSPRQKMVSSDGFRTMSRSC